MLSEFLVYLRLGFEHIADIRGYDHILFVVAARGRADEVESRRARLLKYFLALGFGLIHGSISWSDRE